MGTGRIKKNTLRAKMLGILMLCAMTSLLAAGIVSYMALRMIQNDSIEDNMKMYLDQITRNTDGAYYDMLSIMNYMGPGGLVGNVTDSYLGATDNFDRFIEQRTLREEMAGLGYVNTKLVGVMYYDREGTYQRHECQGAGRKPCFTARGCGVRGKCHTGGPFVYSWEWRRTGLFRHERGGLRKREKAGCLCGDRGGHENS